MRRFFVLLALYCAALYGVGLLVVGHADAARRMVHCDFKNRIIRYPHIHGTFIRCYSPGWWIWVRWPPAI